MTLLNAHAMGVKVSGLHHARSNNKFNTLPPIASSQYCRLRRDIIAPLKFPGCLHNRCGGEAPKTYKMSRVGSSPRDAELTPIQLYSRRDHAAAARGHAPISKSRAANHRPKAPIRWRCAGAALSFTALTAVITPAFAHGGHDLTEQTAWAAWRFTLGVVIPAALVAAIYIAGLWRRAADLDRADRWRGVLFLAGLGSVFLALQSPIDPIAERLFWMHQIQHLLLRMLGPMLIALSWPEGALIAGLPAPIRRKVLSPIISNSAVRKIFGFLTHPFTATALFIFALYFWELPRFHNAALLDERIHDFMHVTMLFAGLIFWVRIFERRPAPHGLRYGVRLMMLWLAALSNIGLGSYTTLKTKILYGAYEAHGRLYDMPALADEQLGGVIIWIPSSMMCLVAILIVIHWWGRRETHLEERRVAAASSAPTASLQPRTADELVAQSRTKNRTLALSMAAFVVTVFACIFAIGVLSRLPAFKGSDVKADSGLITHATSAGDESKRRVH